MRFNQILKRLDDIEECLVRHEKILEKLLSASIVNDIRYPQTSNKTAKEILDNHKK